MSREVIVIFGGFGAGKTTLARRLARQAAARGERAALILCEAGNDTFDSSALAIEGFDIVRIGECNKKGPAAAAECLQSVDAPLVIIEMFAGFPLSGASKFASADRFVRDVFVGNAQNDGDFKNYNISGVSVLLMNKLDTCPDDKIRALLASARAAAPRAFVIPTVESTLTIDEIRGAPAVDTTDISADDSAPHPSLVFREMDLPEELPRRRIELLVNDPPEGTLRIKGCARVEGEREPYMIQVTGRAGSYRKYYTDPPPRRLLWTGLSPRDADLDRILTS